MASVSKTTLKTSSNVGQLTFFDADGTTVSSRMACQSADLITFSSGSASGSVTLAGLKLPTANSHAASKEYVDNLAAGLAYKQNVRAANATAAEAQSTFETSDWSFSTAARGTWSGPTGQLTLDGHTFVDDERVLVWGLGNDGTAAGAEKNGIFVVQGADSGVQTVLTRASDFDALPGTGELQRASMMIEKGNTNEGKRFILQALDLSESETSFLLNDDTRGRLRFLEYSLASNIADEAIVADKLAPSAVTNVKIQDGAVSGPKLASGSVDSDKLAGTSVTAAKLGSNVAGNGLSGGNGSALTVKVDSTTIDTTGSGQLRVKENGITALQLATSVAGAGLTGGGNQALAVNVGTGLEVTGDQVAISDGGVNSTQLAANAVETAKIKDANVTSAKLATDAVETLKIKDSAVTAAKISDNAVTTAKIGAAQVTEAKIAASAVTGAKIADDTLTEQKFQSLCIPTGALQGSSVTTAKIADSNVTTDKINNDAVVSTKIANGAVTANKLAVNSVTADKIGNGEVQTSKIAAGAITGAKIANGTIDNTKLADQAIKASHFNADVAGPGIGLVDNTGQPDDNQLTVNLGAGLSFSGDNVVVSDAGITKAMINTNVVGSGLSGGADSPIAVDVNNLATGGIELNGDGKVQIRQNGFTLGSGSQIQCGEFIADSDRTLKQNIEPMAPAEALEAVDKMGAYSYEFKAKPDDPRCGVIAQELEEVAPRLVKRTAKGTLAVDYNDMSAYLIGAIQALKQKVDEQAAFIEEMKAKCPAACGEGGK